MWWFAVHNGGLGHATALVFLITVGGETTVAGTGVCNNGDAPAHVWLECIIISRAGEEECYFDYLDSGHAVNQCDWSKQCRVRTGVSLQITCASAGDSELILHHGNDTLAGPNITWPIADASVEGNYECRSEDDGSLFANRSIVVDDGVYVIPGGMYGSSYEQFCRADIVPDYIPGYNCSTAQAVERYDPGGSHTVYFHVLGARPINISVGVIWKNHYPVDLHLSWSHLTDTTLPSLHKVEVNLDGVVIVGGTYLVQAYLVVTANTNSQLATMCVLLQIHGQNSVLFPNESLPSVVSVAAGEPAVFACDAQTKFYGGFAYTVAFLVRSTSSAILGQCLNCSFSPADLLDCSTENDGHCSEFTYDNSSSGHSDLRNHHLLARWVSPRLSHSGSEVVCALAYHGTTQWVHTATLTVLPPTPPAQHPHASIAHPQLAAIASSAVLVVCGALCLLGLIVWYRHRHKARSGSQGLEEIPLAESSLPSSGSTTPTVTTPPAIKINLLHTSIERNSHILRPDDNRDSMDSGLDINSAGDMEATEVSSSGHLQVAMNSGQCRSLSDLQSCSAHEVRVYVSYSDSQADWVGDTLLPLLHSFQSTTVTDHEGHMIAGSVISEERLRLVRSADKVIAVVSPDYHCMEWCCYELQHAIQQSPGAEGHVIPILCSGCTELPSTIATLHPIFLHDPNWVHKLRVAIRRRHHCSS